MATENEVTAQFCTLKKSGDLLGVYKFLYSLAIPDLLLCLRNSGIHLVSETEIKKAVISSCTEEIKTQVRAAISVSSTSRLSPESKYVRRQ